MQGKYYVGHITLIGMAGAGKSFVGQALAKRLKYNFIDVDEIIESKYKAELKNIIEKLGKPGFIKVEEKTILRLEKKLKNGDGHVVSPGGSVIYSKKAMGFLKKNSTVVFLNTPFKVIIKRVPSLSERGIINLGSQNLKRLYKKRLPLYKKYADVTLKLPEKIHLNTIVAKIIYELEKIKNYESRNFI
ncbi:MAG: shikimate kinase [Candidatus Firestonebacteria bacterium]